MVQLLKTEEEDFPEIWCLPRFPHSVLRGWDLPSFLVCLQEKLGILEAPQQLQLPNLVIWISPPMSCFYALGACQLPV